MNYEKSKNRESVIIKKAYRIKKLNKSKKKAGFTLIEIIAVIAIIGILAAAILPRVNGYIKEAKKVKVVDQCRKVVMAVESYNIRYDKPLEKTIHVSTAQANIGVNKYLEGVVLGNLDTNTTSLQNCYDVVGGAEFDFIVDTDKLNPGTITVAR